MSNQDWLQRLLKIEGRDATWRAEDFPIVVERAKGSLIYDTEGRSYIDMIAGFGSLPLGHNHESLQRVLRSDADEMVQGLGDVYASRFKIEFMEELLSFLPKSFNRAILGVTGSQAVETAMKTAILSGGSGFISFSGAYHGLEMASLALNSNPHFRKPFDPWLNGAHVQHLPFECDPRYVRDAMENFRRRKIKAAAIIVEPIQGRGGFIPASFDWLRELKQICEEEKCLLIFDEVFTGFGRSGRTTYADQIPCDLICFGKTIGGGMPISACVGTDKVMEAWPLNTGEAIHTGTFFGHPLSCRVGLASLKAIRELNLIERSARLGARVLHHLREALKDCSLIRSIRGEGLMLAIEFKNFEHSISVMMELRSFGVFLIPCGVKGECVSLTPALNISEEILDQGLSRLVEVIARLERKQ